MTHKDTGRKQTQHNTEKSKVEQHRPTTIFFWGDPCAREG